MHWGVLGGAEAPLGKSLNSFILDYIGLHWIINYLNHLLLQLHLKHQTPENMKRTKDATNKTKQTQKESGRKTKKERKLESNLQ